MLRRQFFAFSDRKCDIFSYGESRKAQKTLLKSLVERKDVFTVKNSQKNVTSKRMFYITVDQSIKKTPIASFVEKEEGKVEDFPNVVVLIDTKDTL